MIDLTADQQRRLCPHCAHKRTVGGVELIESENTYERKYRRIPGGERFLLMWLEESRVWLCPGCLDVCEKLPEMSNVIDLAERRERKRVAW